MSHLLDANTLIEAKNRYYRMAICPGYWSCLEASSLMGDVASVASVAAELRRGNDELAQWADANVDLFLAESDAATQGAFGEIAAYIAGLADGMKPGAMEEFLSGADPWLIAKARVNGFTIVTHEQRNPAIKRKFTIPNVCDHFGVLCIDTFDLLQRLDARFVLASRDQAAA